MSGIRTVLHPPFKTVDGKTIKVGETYYFDHWQGVKPVKCVAENRGSRFWWGQDPDGTEMRVKFSGTRSVYGSQKSIDKKNLKELQQRLAYATQALKRAQSDWKKADKQCAAAEVKFNKKYRGHK